MGCKSSLCKESELYLTQEYHKEPNEKYTGLLITEATDRFTSLKSIISIMCWENIGYRKIAYEWLTEVALWAEENSLSTEDCKNTVNLSSDMEEIYIKHEFNFVRSFHFIKSFAKRNCSNFNDTQFDELENFVFSLRPIGVYAYLRLGKVFDCGLGLEKVLNSAQMNKILAFSDEKESILLWAGSLILTGVSFSAFSLSRTVEFYIFDGHKAQNYLKAISLFEFFAAPIEKDMKEQIFMCKNEAVTAVIEMNANKILSLGIVLHNPDAFWSLANTIGKDTAKAMVPAIKAHLNPSSVGIFLTNEGYGICEICTF
ncbi:hypothetical protein SteCoe_31424 [Stentor coeruleus]|uniref:Uncharacterized protein n=1 Tax=Stentor coeruleus TaxID=5963 RepID=A0A1R2B1D9_9CILI|nr:hypothetical protein SteCoe_31424 [Stentor coeruleus]